MADLEEQLTDTRRDLFMQIRIICDPLYKFDGPLTRDFTRTAGACLSDLLQLLNGVQDPETTIDAVLIDTVVYSLLRLFKQTAQISTRPDTIVQGVLENLLFLLNETAWACTFTPTLMKQYLILFTNCLNQTRQSNTNINSLDGDGDKQNSNQVVSAVTSGATEIIKLLAIECISASLPIPASRVTRTTSPYKKNQPYQHRHNMNLLPDLLSEQFIYVISQCITELLDTIEHDHDLALRLAALDTLHQLLFDNIQESDYLISFMPGVVSKLCKVVWQKQEKENNQVITYALDLLGDMVQTVMDNRFNKSFISNVDSLDDLKHLWHTISIRDKSLGSGTGNDDDDEDKSNNADGIHSTSANPQQGSIQVKRSQEWYTKSKSTLYTFFKDIMKISHHPNWNVRLAFVNLSYKLLTCCWATLDNCIPIFIDTMVQLIDDDYPQVATTCKERIAQLKSTRLFVATLMPKLKEGLYSAILSLPQQLISGDEQSKLYAMRRITGYTYFLQHHAGTVFDTSLNRISDGWLAALEIDKHSLNVLEEKQSARYIELENDGIMDEAEDHHPSRTVTFPKLRFTHLVTTATADQAAHMLNVIGRYAPVQRWLTHFMEYIQVDAFSNDNALSSLDQLLPQAAFVVHSLLAGAASTEIDDDISMDSMVTYDDDDDDNDDDGDGDQRLAKLELQQQAQRILKGMAETLMAATTTTLGSKNKKATAVMADNSTRVDLEGNRVVTLCLGLQIVSLAVGVLGKEKTTEHLITLLYPILAHLGSTNVAIHSYAMIALDNIALICGERNGRLLAMSNMDYIINSVSQRIWMLYDNPQAPLVLKALVHVCGLTSLDYLQDSVEEIFYALDRYHLHEGLCRQLCGVLVEIVQTAATSISAAAVVDSDGKRSSGNGDDDDDRNKSTVGSVSSPIEEFIKQHQQAKEDASTVFDTPSTMDDIGKYFMAQRKDGKEDKDILELMAQTEAAGKAQNNDDGNATDDGGDDAEGNQKADDSTIPLTNPQDLTLKIMLKSTHFLTSPSDQLRSQMLQLFTNGVRILATKTDKLDPVIHQAWPLIMNRLDDTTHYVAFYAAQLVQVLAETRGEFISQRFMDNVWPRYQRLLHQGDINMSKATLIYSTYSYPHRLQRCLLETLMRAADHIPLNQPVVLAMLESTTWLLSEIHVHPELQTLAIQLYLTLFRHHPDTVWLHVFTLLETPVLQPPQIRDDLDIKLNALVVPDWMAAHNKDYYTNAGRIMASMDQDPHV
ncbi:armadillo-type protein [Absidia repens]|uniref:Armadillo-type protein n=1 Tax=Absidia repens TaxID=90262 RepID=A0A1X2J026_9FUNG|nr:armadillo-type protein [Absidia repens]